MWCTEVGPAPLLGHHNGNRSDSVTTDVTRLKFIDANAKSVRRAVELRAF